jgi:hypothetical protein
MIVKAWEKERAQLVADAMRDLITMGVTGAEYQDPLVASADVPVSADAQARLAAYGILAALNTHEPWITVGSGGAPPFENSCSHYAGGNRLVQFRKENGRVVIRGLVAGAFLATVIFTLPPGYRPSLYENLLMSAEGMDANLVVQPDGQIYLNIASAANPENYASFAGVNFFPD